MGGSDFVGDVPLPDAFGSFRPASCAEALYDAAPIQKTASKTALTHRVLILCLWGIAIVQAPLIP